MSSALDSLKQALELHRAGNLDEAERLCRQVLRAAPESAHALHLLGSIEHAKGQHIAAVDHLTRAVMYDGREPAFHATLASAQLALDRVDEAIRSLRQVLVLRPDHARTHNDLGVLLAGRGRLDEAAACFREVLRLRSDFAPAHNNLGNILNQQGDISGAIECFRAAKRTGPQLVQAYNNLANALKAAGRPDEAIAEYREALRIAPDFAEGHYNLGVSLAEHGDTDGAIAAYREALRLNPQMVEARFNLGSQLLVQGAVGEALEQVNAVIARRPELAEAHYLAASALKLLGRADEARRALSTALSLNASLASAHHLLGNLEFDEGRFDAAVAAYRTALAHDPGLIEARVSLASALRQIGRLAEAEGELRNVLAERPECAEAHAHLGLVLDDRGQGDDAVSAFRESLRLSPGYVIAHNGLGAALSKQGKIDEAVACFREAVRLAPNFVAGYNNLGTTLKELGRPTEAIICFEEALRLYAAHSQGQFPRGSEAQLPSVASLHKNLGMMLLLVGQFSEGWSEYEWRWQAPDFPQRPWPQPLWDGSPLEGRTIVLRCEQGLGDSLQFVRYAALVKQRGGTVVLACPRRLSALLGTSRGVDRVIADDEPLGAIDFQIPLLSLPRVLGTELASVPADVPYLSARGDLIERWAGALRTDDRLRVGIGWQGNPTYRDDRWRSFPLAEFAPLAAVEGVRLISLQRGPGSEHIEKAGFPLEDLGSRLDTGDDAFVDTAAVLKHLDLVVTSDTALAHLAGTLAARVWVALPTAPDWRWMLEREDSPWYPTMRLFRQESRGDWGAVFARIAAELAALARDVRSRGVGRDSHESTA